MNNEYINNSASLGELLRLNYQAALVGKVTGLLPTALEALDFSTALDVGCGPGQWAFDLALRFPEREIAGIDCSREMVDYANGRARTARRSNVSYGVHDFLEPDLPFDPGSFDLVQLRFAMSWITGYASWLDVLSRCYTLLKPGGVVIVTEVEGLFTNSAPLQRIYEILGEAFFRTGHSLSISPRFFGVVTHLGLLLHESGFQQVQSEAHVVDFSYYHEEENRAWLQSFQHLLLESAPFLFASGGTSVEELTELEQRMTIDMYHQTFCGIAPLFTFFAHKKGVLHE